MAEVSIGGFKKPQKPELLYDEQYRHPIVASVYNGHTSLLSNVPGQPWMVEWYRQVHGLSTEAQGFQPDSIETYQSYERIKGLVVKIDGEMSNNWDGQWSTIGQEAIIRTLFDLAPVPFDVFIADIGDGRAGLFQCYDEPRLRTVAVDKIYEINIRLIAIVDKTIETNLNKKTIREWVYSKDSAIRGGNAVITTTDYDDNIELAKLQTLIIQDYLSEFYYDPEKTIAVPNVTDDEKLAGSLKYDPYLTRFLTYTFTQKKAGLREPIRTLNVEFGKTQVGGKKLNVWDMFYQMNFKYPQRYKQDFYLHQSINLLNTLYYAGIFYSKFDSAILTEQYGAADVVYRYHGGMYFDEFDEFSAYNDSARQEEGKKYDYFFSDDFYTGNPTLPHEKFIFSFFRDKIIDKPALINVLNDYWSLTPIQRCYMGGIYVLAVKISLSTTYKYL